VSGAPGSVLPAAEADPSVGKYPYGQWVPSRDDISWLPLPIVAEIHPDLYFALTDPQGFAARCNTDAQRTYLAQLNPKGFLEVFPGDEARQELAAVDPEAFSMLFPEPVAAAA